MASGLGLRHSDLGSPPNIRVVSHQKNKGNRYHDSVYEFLITILEILALNRSFSLSRTKKINWKPSSGRNQENEML